MRGQRRQIHLALLYTGTTCEPRRIPSVVLKPELTYDPSTLRRKTGVYMIVMVIATDLVESVTDVARRAIAGGSGLAAGAV